jgi:hypothetical protein
MCAIAQQPSYLLSMTASCNRCPAKPARAVRQTATELQAAGELLELIWSGQRYADPYPDEHYRNLLQTPMTTVLMNGGVNGNGIAQVINGTRNWNSAKPDLPW